MGFGMVVVPVGLDLSMVLAPVCLGFAVVSAFFLRVGMVAAAFSRGLVTVMARLVVAPFSLDFGMVFVCLITWLWYGGPFLFCLFFLLYQYGL